MGRSAEDLHITAGSYAAARSSSDLPQKGVEVLLMWEQVDEVADEPPDRVRRQAAGLRHPWRTGSRDLEDEASKQAQEEAEKANAGLVERVKKSLGRR